MGRHSVNGGLSIHQRTRASRSLPRRACKMKCSSDACSGVWLLWGSLVLWFAVLAFGRLLPYLGPGGG